MIDVSKKEIKELLSEQADVILGAVDEKLSSFKTDISGDIQILRTEIREEFVKTNDRIDKIELAIRELTLTLDEFMKRVMHQDEEIAVLNAKVDKIVGFIKQKFGVEITAQ